MDVDTQTVAGLDPSDSDSWMSQRVQVALAAIVALVLVVVLGAFGIATARGGEALPGVTVEDIDLGGLGQQDIVAELAPIVAARSSDPVVFTLDDQEFEVDPAAVGASVDAEAVADRALAAGRTGSFFPDRWAALRGTDVAVDVQVDADREAVAGRVTEIAETVNADVFAGDITVDPASLEVAQADPTPGIDARQEEAVDLVVEALDRPGPDTLELPVDMTPAETDAADVDAVADAALAAIAEDLVLTSEDGEVTLARREVAALLRTTQTGSGDDATLQLRVTQQAVEDVLVPLAGPLLRDARNAGYTAPRGPGTTFDAKFDVSWSKRETGVVEVVGGQTGTQVGPELAAEALTAAVREAARSVQLPLAETPPAFSTEQAEEQRPTHLLSTFTTYHACCAARVTNIQKLADLVDGTVVLPDEQFSINQISGVRECSKGFAAAGMILDGEIVDSCGGGVSQFGTTTVNALFFAGFQPDAYKPHSFYISRYPLAREATLNFPSPDIDVRFTNTTGSPVVVKTSYSGTSITVSFYGRSDVTEVRADVGDRTNFRSAGTERRVNRNLAPGTSRTIQSGQDGFYVPLTRTVVRGGESSTDDWGNAYVAKKTIVEYNPDQPAPEPDPPDSTES